MPQHKSGKSFIRYKASEPIGIVVLNILTGWILILPAVLYIMFAVIIIINSLITKIRFRISNRKPILIF